MERLPERDPEEPVVHLPLNGEVLEGRRENVALFTFAGELAIYDGILYQYFEGENPDGAQAAYFTHNEFGDAFHSVKLYMIVNNFRCLLNLNELPGFLVRSLGLDTQLALPEHATEPLESSQSILDVIEDVKAKHYIEFNKFRNKPLPSAREVNIQIFKYLMDRVEDPTDSLTFEQALWVLESFNEQ